MCYTAKTSVLVELQGVNIPLQGFKDCMTATVNSTHGADQSKGTVFGPTLAFQLGASTGLDGPSRAWLPPAALLCCYSAPEDYDIPHSHADY